MDLKTYNEILKGVCDASYTDDGKGRYLVARKVDEKIRVSCCDTLELAVKVHRSFSEEDQIFPIFPPEIPHPLFRRF